MFRVWRFTVTGMGIGVRVCIWSVRGFVQSMENIRDLVYEGWTSKATSKEKGKGPGKGKGRSDVKEDVSEEDGSWGRDLVRLRQRI